MDCAWNAEEFSGETFQTSDAILQQLRDKINNKIVSEEAIRGVDNMNKTREVEMSPELCRRASALPGPYLAGGYKDVMIPIHILALYL